MENGIFQIECIECENLVQFSIDHLERENALCSCSHCHKKYSFGEEKLKRQLLMFASLCKEIRRCEEILGKAHIAVDVGPHHVEIPFKILLTRLKSTLDLEIGERKMTVTCRVETVGAY